MKQIPFFILAALCAFVPASADAGPIIRSGETISVDASQVLTGDFYGLAGIVTISGEAREDAYVAGGTVTVNAPVRGDLTVAGGSVQVHGAVGDDVRVVGGDVTIAESVQGDVIMVGGLLTILSTATVEGDVIFLGGEAVLEGNVNGSVHGKAERARINGAVGGDITITAGSLLTLGDNADVMGSITYESRSDLVRAQDARVGGDIRKVGTLPVAERNFLRMYLTAVIVLAFTTFSLYFIARSRFASLVHTATENPGLSGLVGLGILFMTPFMASVFLVSIVGSLLGGVILIAYALFVMLAVVLSGAVLGLLGRKVLFKKNEVTLGSTLFGVALFAALGLVPYVGGLLLLACLSVTLGALGMALYRGIRS